MPRRSTARCRGPAPSGRCSSPPRGIPRLVAGAETKIVWKIGGAGDFTVSATGPDGSQAKLAWGPTGHSGSTWERPGTEYGTGFVFPEPGCWTITAQRANGERGELRLTVA
ncbi:hypothetical protein Ais01nite_39530 [Asanoa ishikariensis]|nr:hypothetical protein Ais01nite_39530 [Asanoa ishikariensis]